MKKLFISLLLSLPISVLGQTDRYAVYWIRYQNQIAFSPILYWNNEIDNRRFIAPDVQNQLIFHSRLHYKRDRWDYAAGLTISWAYASRPGVPIKHPTTEVRPVLETSYEIPMKGWALQQRLRVDNRFFDENRFENIFDEYDFTLRMRYRIQARIILKKESKSSPVLRIADEIMVNHRENFFDQNRIYATLDLPFTKSWSVETGYIYIYQQRFGTDTFFERHVLRFSLLHKILK